MHQLAYQVLLRENHKRLRDPETLNASKIAITKAEVPELTVRIKNWFGFPISNIKVSLFYNVLSGSGKTSGSFALSKLSDESGEVKLKLIKGSCAIHIPRYNVNAVVDVLTSKTKELRVLDIGRLMTSLDRNF